MKRKQQFWSLDIYILDQMYDHQKFDQSTAKVFYINTVLFF